MTEPEATPQAPEETAAGPQTSGGAEETEDTQALSAAQLAEAAASAATQTTQTPEGAPVLLCEGDRDLRLALGALLERAGYRVQAAGDLRQAASAALGSAPRCIVLSLPLPGADPSETFEGLRRLAGERAVPVVLIAPPELPVEAAEDLPGGIEARLRRTFRPSELLREVGRACRRAPEPAV